MSALPTGDAPQSDLIARFSNLNKRLSAIRDVLVQRSQNQKYAFEEAGVLRDHLYTQHLAYRQRISQLASLFAPVVVAPVQSPDASELQLRDEQQTYDTAFQSRRVRFDTPHHEGEQEHCRPYTGYTENGDTRPGILHFDSDEDDAEFVDETASDFHNNPKGNITERPLREETEQKGTTATGNRSIEAGPGAQALAEGGESPAKEEPVPESEQSSYRHRHEEDNALEQDQDPLNDSGLTETSMNENLNGPLQPQTIVRYHLIDEPTQTVDEQNADTNAARGDERECETAKTSEHRVEYSASNFRDEVEQIAEELVSAVVAHSEREDVGDRSDAEGPASAMKVDFTNHHAEDTFFTFAPERSCGSTVEGARPEVVMGPANALDLFNVLHLSAALETSRLESPMSTYTRERSTSTPALDNPQGTPTLEASRARPTSPVNIEDLIKSPQQLSFDRSFASRNISVEPHGTPSQTTLMADPVPLISETSVAFPLLSPGEEVVLNWALTLKMDHGGRVSGKLSCSRPTPSNANEARDR